MKLIKIAKSIWEKKYMKYFLFFCDTQIKEDISQDGSFFNTLEKLAGQLESIFRLATEITSWAAELN